MGEKNRPAYRKYLRAGLAETDEELREAISHKAVGSERFQLRVQDLYRQLADRQGAKVDVSMRRAEVGVDPKLVYREVSREAGLLNEEWEVRRGHRAEKDFLIEAWTEWSGLLGREIGSRLGHGDGSIVSRRMNAVRNERKSERVYQRRRKAVWNALSKVKA